MNAIERLLLKGLSQAPDDWALRLELASKLAERGAKGDARDILAEAPGPPHTEEEFREAIRLGLAEVPAKQGAYLEEFIERDPTNAWGYRQRARVQLHAGDKDAAAASYQRAVELDPGNRIESLDALLEKPAEKAPEPEREPEPEAVAEMAVAVEAEPEPEPKSVPVAAESRAEGSTPILPVPLAPPGEREKSAPVEAVPVAQALPEEADGHSEDHDAGRHFIVTEGEAVHAAMKESDAKQKVSALTVAVLVHVAIALALTAYVVSEQRTAPPQIVATSMPNLDEQQIEQEEVQKKVQRAPVQSAAAQMNFVSVNAASSVALPSVDTPLISFDPVGVGDSLGTSMSFEMGEDGGMVSFFGSKSVSKKVIFVVDYSASMSGAKDKLMRAELSKSLEALPSGVEYQVILFAGPAWYAGQEVGKSAKVTGKYVANTVQDGSKKFIWYEGWDEKERHSGSKKNALSHYEGGMDDLPDQPYIKATRANLHKTQKHVKDTPLVFGTDWRAPMRMALDMNPDTIYFMTDGSMPGSTSQKKETVSDILTFNRRGPKAKINTIAMMVPQAKDQLEELAEGSRGEFTMVLEDGTVVRGREIDKVAGKK